ncbi:GNAT family N-acetyltransferase [Caulobacter segnis]|uniref:GNAT family N-acetyltransferase n=1 Tax=Caulobacter segnis TaxID=88688 RepID=A0A2W5VB74_9CAUL|nr:GNAT family N-acetyltransferase [Caulobacter segnis]PZR33806.1 MAG: GNAT family N-acetyltransferase [Caulobacter segnis]
MPAPVLITARLTLAPPTLADFEDSRTMWADPVVTRHLGGRPFTDEESWTRLLRARGLWDVMGFGYWAVRETSTGRYVGEVGFADLRRELEPSLDGLPEMGWVLTAWSHGQGFGTEAVRAGLAWIDETLAPDVVPCIIGVENAASIALAVKTGFRAKTHATYRGSPILMMERRPDPA